MEKKIQLFSGGFDSILQEWLIKPNILLYVDMETSYSQVEIEALGRLSNYYTDRLIIIKFPLGIYERTNKYLPYRNLILVTLAMQYGQHVYLGLNASDDAPDKDALFLKRTTTLFRHLNKNAIGDMGWDNKNFSVTAPYSNYTKTEMVAKALQNGLAKESIQEIRTCYDSISEIGCGRCRPCLNKAIALLNNDISIENVFEKPITSRDIYDLYKSIRERESDGDNFPKKYIDEVKEARRKVL